MTNAKVSRVFCSCCSHLNYLLQDAELDPPTFTEEDLMTFYMDVLAHPEQENTLRDNNVDLESQHQKDLDVTESVALRLRDGVYHSSRLTATLREHSQVSTHAETSEDGATPAYQRVVNQVQQILSEVERVNSTIASTSVESSTALPMPLLSMEEWGSVLRSTVCSHVILFHPLFDRFASYILETRKPQKR